MPKCTALLRLQSVAAFSKPVYEPKKPVYEPKKAVYVAKKPGELAGPQGTHHELAALSCLAMC